MNNLLVTISAIGLFVGITFVVVSSSSADAGFRVSDDQRLVMQQYDEACPFTAAERADLLSNDSVRKYVEFIDVYCDEEHREEQITIRYIGESRETSKKQFEEWMYSNTLSTLSTITVQEIE